MGQSDGVSNLLKRAAIMVKDHDYDDADKIIDQILDLEPRNAEAYFLKTLVDCRVTSAVDIDKETLKNNKSFARALQFASMEEKSVWEPLLTQSKHNSEPTIRAQPIVEPASNTTTVYSTDFMNRLDTVVKKYQTRSLQATTFGRFVLQSHGFYGY